MAFRPVALACLAQLQLPDNAPRCYWQPEINRSSDAADSSFNIGSRNSRCAPKVRALVERNDSAKDKA
jgi:hypothetical protein